MADLFKARLLRHLAGDHDDHDHDHDDANHDHEHEHEHEHAMMTLDEMKTFKVVFIFVFFLIAFLGLIPRVLGSCRESKAALSFMNCFAGGVFLAISLIHLFPEGAAQFDEWAGDDFEFPLFYTLSFVGYLSALMFDRVIFAKHQTKIGHSHGDAKAPTAGDKVNYEPAVNDSNREGGGVKPLEIESQKTSASKVHVEGAATGGVWNSKPAAIVVGVGLGFQVLVEGCGLGSGDDFENGAQMAVSLLINSTTISLALGSAFTKADFSTRQVLIGLGVFACVAPIAIIIGMAAESGLPTLMNVILLSLTTGIYIYFSCSEVFVKEFQTNENVVLKIVAITLGLIIILGLVFIESGHDHGGPNEEMAELCASMAHDDHHHRF